MMATGTFERRGLLRALRHANFRRYFIGQGVSLLGTWMQQTALAWLVYRLTASAFLMGVNTFASQVPSLLLLPLAGVLLDRWDRLRLIRITQALAMIQAFVLAALVLADVVVVWHVMVLAFSLGCVNAFDLPARQALLPELLQGKADLSNAIALNSSAFNLARLSGPAFAGLLIDLGGDGAEGWCFLLNGLSFLAVLAALARVTATAQPRPQPLPMLGGLREGVQFAVEQPAMRAVLLLVATIGFLGMPYTLLVPVFAKDVLHGGPSSYGLLLTASGLGALAGAFYLAGRPNIRGSSSRIAVSGIVGAAALAAFALSRDFALSMLLLGLTGAAMMLAVVSCNTIVQTLVPDDKRGRIMSLYNLAFMGLTPFGSLIVGSITQVGGATAGMLVCAGGSLVGALVFASNLPAIRAALRAYLAAQQSIGPTEPAEPTLAEEAAHG